MPLGRTIAVLSDPTLRAILGRVSAAPRRAGELASGFAISRPAVCKHTRLLASAGLIQVKKNGRERIYELAPSGREEIREMIKRLEVMEQFWEAVLEAFKRHTEEKK
jgi:DNA-binding transcriptional ArsR family regulator